MKKILLVVLYYILVIIGVDAALRGLRWIWDGTPWGYRFTKKSEKTELRKAA